MNDGIINGGLGIVSPTPEPTEEPTETPTPEPTEEPTPEPTEEPTEEPTPEPTEEPTEAPTPEPTEEPTPVPSPISTPIPEPVQETGNTDSGQTDYSNLENVEALMQQNIELQTQILNTERVNGVLLAVLLAAVIMEIFWKRILK